MIIQPLSNRWFHLESTIWIPHTYIYIYTWLYDWKHLYPWYLYILHIVYSIKPGLIDLGWWVWGVPPKQRSSANKHPPETMVDLGNLDILGSIERVCLILGWWDNTHTYIYIHIHNLLYNYIYNYIDILVWSSIYPDMISVYVHIFYIYISSYLHIQCNRISIGLSTYLFYKIYIYIVCRTFRGDIYWYLPSFLQHAVLSAGSQSWCLHDGVEAGDEASDGTGWSLMPIKSYDWMGWFI